MTAAATVVRPRSWVGPIAETASTSASFSAPVTVQQGTWAASRRGRGNGEGVERHTPRTAVVVGRVDQEELEIVVPRRARRGSCSRAAETPDRPPRSPRGSARGGARRTAKATSRTPGAPTIKNAAAANRSVLPDPERLAEHHPRGAAADRHPRDRTPGEHPRAARHAREKRSIRIGRRDDAVGRLADAREEGRAAAGAGRTCARTPWRRSARLQTPTCPGQAARFAASGSPAEAHHRADQACS